MGGGFFRRGPVRTSIYRLATYCRITMRSNEFINVRVLSRASDFQEESKWRGEVAHCDVGGQFESWNGWHSQERGRRSWGQRFV